MINSELFDRILLEPARSGADTLYVVSGYATAAMVFHHLEKVTDVKDHVVVQLLVGMCPRDGLSLSNHRGFQRLMSDEFHGRFQCSYIMQPPPVHSKVYAWFASDLPISGFVGSANYTQRAFLLGTQRELMDQCDAAEARDYFQALVGDSIYCSHAEAESCVQIYKDSYHSRVRSEQEQREAGAMTASSRPELSGLRWVRVSLLDRRGRLPPRSGLNWGQRPEQHREPNQAYIRLDANVYNTDFFPPRTVHFTILTDDDKTLICTRAQDNGKAIHTPQNNSLIGEYFRSRLGVPNGEPVLKEHLERHGRTDIDFFKIDEETYFMDFSPSRRG